MSGRTKGLIEQAVRQLPGPTCNASITLALSGGVDSSVAGLLLRERGWKVNPVLFRCWDDHEDGKQSCFDHEQRLAEEAVRSLDIAPLKVYDFVREYWTDVFEKFLSGLQEGQTPNPDLACNRFVKFGAFPDRLVEHGGQLFATGHYARLRKEGEKVKLLTAIDGHKDQSYFLAGVNGEQFRHAVFPVGGLLKSEVREIAKGVGLPAAYAKSSRGICFVGKRKMDAFLGQYLEGGCGGKFVDVDSGAVVDELNRPGYSFTIGQRARIGGVSDAFYVVGKRDGDVIVAKSGHDELYMKEIFCGKVDWVCGSVEGIREGVWLKCKVCSTGMKVDCFVFERDGGIVMRFKERVRKVSEGQALVLYDGVVCLGAAWPGGERDAI